MEKIIARETTKTISVTLDASDLAAAVRKYVRAPDDAAVDFQVEFDEVAETAVLAGAGVSFQKTVKPRGKAAAAKPE